jgi:hypothetical protein
MACCAWNLLGFSIPLCLFTDPGHVHSRALLSSEALEEHFCVAIDAEVLDGLGILRRTCRILPCSRLGERRAPASWLLGLSRRQSCVNRGESRIASLVELVLSEHEAATHGRHFLGCSLASTHDKRTVGSRPRPTTPR